MQRRIGGSIILLVMILTLSFFNYQVDARPADLIYQIPIESTVNPGMLNLVRKGIDQAEKAGADLIIFNIDTYGGLVDSGIKIKDEIFATSIPTVTYVSKRAWSAGALIALAGERLVMTSGSSIGAAETRPKEEKYISALRKEFKATAQRRGRNPDLATAMVDADIEIEGIIAKDKLLTLTGSEAKDNQIANLIVNDFNQLLADVGMQGAKIVEVNLSSAEKLARLVTNPGTSGFLLTVGFIALVFEAIAPGWGVGGTIGLISLGLFFSGYIINGVAGWGLVILFLIGIILLGLEVFVVPGFGVTGIGGIVAILSSIYFTFPTPNIALSVLATVIVLSIIGTAIIIKYFGTSRLWYRISLEESQTKDAGYVANLGEEELLGREGRAVTSLRPAGIIQIDGKRYDVISEGGFINKDELVRIIKVNGSKIIVKSKT